MNQSRDVLNYQSRTCQIRAFTRKVVTREKRISRDAREKSESKMNRRDMKSTAPLGFFFRKFNDAHRDRKLMHAG
ncbi:MAG TPA: hypothetical protein VFW94_19915 [Candidatus Acidoferrales bacterium]|nr:hypothetical protein [Candidatus Acidoferrales bacterium]